MSFVSFLPEGQSRMKKGSITRFRLDPKRPPETDWRAFDAMGEDERHQAALSDSESPPATEAQLARARRVSTAARWLAQLGGSEPALKAPPRRRQKAE
jgi:hypothetical protein